MFIFSILSRIWIQSASLLKNGSGHRQKRTCFTTLNPMNFIVPISLNRLEINSCNSKLVNIFFNNCANQWSDNAKLFLLFVTVPTFGVARAAGGVHDDGWCGGGGEDRLPRHLRQVVIAPRLLAFGHHVPEGDQGHVTSAHSGY